jgi:hypothetical protein
MQAVTRHAAVTNYASTAEPSPTPTLFGVSLTLSRRASTALHAPRRSAHPLFLQVVKRRKESLSEINSQLGVGFRVEPFIVHRLSGDLNGGDRAMFPERVIDAPGYLVAPEIGGADRNPPLGRYLRRLNVIGRNTASTWNRSACSRSSWRRSSTICPATAERFSRRAETTWRSAMPPV